MTPSDTPQQPDSLRGVSDGTSVGSRPPAETRPGKSYRPPRLVSYGRLADITQFGGSQQVDSGAGLGDLP